MCEKGGINTDVTEKGRPGPPHLWKCFKMRKRNPLGPVLQSGREGGGRGLPEVCTATSTLESSVCKIFNKGGTLTREKVLNQE